MRTAVIVGLVVIVVLAFVVIIPRAKEQNVTMPVSGATVPTVFVYDFYTKGLHTLRGSVAVANTCTTLSAIASLVAGASSTPDTIALTLSIPQDVGICLAQPATTSFSTSITAPKGATIEATVNGRSAPVILQ